MLSDRTFTLLRTLLIASSLLQNCATSQKAVSQKSTQKAAQKDAAAKRNQGEAKAQKKINARMQMTNPTEELAAWTMRMSVAATPFTVQDRQFVLGLPTSPKPGSLAEAATVVGILRDILTPPGGAAGTFQKVDQLTTKESGSGDTAVLPKPASQFNQTSQLEARCRR